ncbi:MAG: hypothetical protein DWP95_08815 [Proteobacteria bacterium]|nr:MAG: hypothetical protein DWP95_08815 [Pseudomonadota bacterium]
MKKDALDRLIEKNEKQTKIRTQESIFAIKGSVFGIIGYLTLIPAAYWLAQDHVTFFNHELWGISKIVWVIGLLLLVLIGLINIFTTLSFIPVIKLSWPHRKKLWAAKKWRPIHLVLMLMRLIMPFLIIYLILFFTKFMKNTGNDISSYVDLWHEIPISIVFTLTSVLMIYLTALIIFTIIHYFKLLYRLYTNEQAIIQHFSHQPKNDDWI